jgi:hypothetical protein
MTRRFDFDTAQKVSLALLTKAAFGGRTGLRYAKLARLSAFLVVEVFSRPTDWVRKEVQSADTIKDRRSQKRV